MCVKEKNDFVCLEIKMRQQVNHQWDDLKTSIKSISKPVFIDPKWWGHKTLTWRKPGNQTSTPSTPEHVPAPPILPHQSTDNYTNVSTILTCQKNGDWQVDEEEVETSSDHSSLQAGGSEERFIPLSCRR